MIRTRCVYGPVEKDDGTRVLVTRYWPRGVKKEKAGVWYKDLGAAPELIKAWKAGGMTWAEFKKAYLSEFSDALKKNALEELRAFIKGRKTVTLLCTCHEDEVHCHRTILKDMLKG